MIKVDKRLRNGSNVGPVNTMENGWSYQIRGKGIYVKNAEGEYMGAWQGVASMPAEIKRFFSEDELWEMEDEWAFENTVEERGDDGEDGNPYVEIPTDEPSALDPPVAEDPEFKVIEDEKNLNEELDKDVSGNKVILKSSVGYVVPAARMVSHSYTDEMLMQNSAAINWVSSVVNPSGSAPTRFPELQPAGTNAVRTSYTATVNRTVASGSASIDKFGLVIRPSLDNHMSQLTANATNDALTWGTATDHPKYSAFSSVIYLYRVTALEISLMNYGSELNRSARCYMTTATDAGTTPLITSFADLTSMDYVKDYPSQTVENQSMWWMPYTAETLSQGGAIVPTALTYKSIGDPTFDNALYFVAIAAPSPGSDVFQVRVTMHIEFIPPPNQQFLFDLRSAMGSEDQVASALDAVFGTTPGANLEQGNLGKIEKELVNYAKTMVQGIAVKGLKAGANYVSGGTLGPLVDQMFNANARPPPEKLPLHLLLRARTKFVYDHEKELWKNEYLTPKQAEQRLAKRLFAAMLGIEKIKDIQHNTPWGVLTRRFDSKLFEAKQRLIHSKDKIKSVGKVLNRVYREAVKTSGPPKKSIEKIALPSKTKPVVKTVQKGKMKNAKNIHKPPKKTSTSKKKKK